MSSNENTNNSQEDVQELSALYEETGGKLSEHYYLKMFNLLEQIGLNEPNVGPVPPEIWFGIAEAIADCSGYHVVLQAEILEPTEEPNTYRTVGRREIATADPGNWVREA
jgi:hypothetical protein